jgi:hypothetical protein
LNEIDYEVVFAGDLDKFVLRPYLAKYSKLRYIHTGKIKPAQCYQIAFMEAKGELILWACDDAEFDPYLLDRAYTYWKSLKNTKAILSLQTNENSRKAGLYIHTLLGWNVNTSLMAPIALLDREYMKSLGGFDRRYISGQWENDAVKRITIDGGKVYPFTEAEVRIDHIIKHNTENNPFWSAYGHDRKVLEDTWIEGGYKPESPIINMPGEYAKNGKPFKFKVLDNRKELYEPTLPFEPYIEEDILTKNQGPSGIWEMK